MVRWQVLLDFGEVTSQKDKYILIMGQTEAGKLARTFKTVNMTDSSRFANYHNSSMRREVLEASKKENIKLLVID